VRKVWRDEAGLYRSAAPRTAAGRKLLAALEAKARQRDCHTLRLETGIHQHAAIALYTRNGYQTRCAFAPYQPDPLSVFMEKPLFADLRSAAL
jgi:putative acetyltransferase